MSVSKELLLAILAMDSYHRNEGSTLDLAGGSIGEAAIIPLDSLPGVRVDEWFVSGFSGTVYEVDGERIISYRGTNFEVEFSGYDPTAWWTQFETSEAGKDAMNGWLIGIGYSEATQAELAINLWEAVAGHPIFLEDNSGRPRPIVTGHSLGAGLAGFTSLLSGSEGWGFDHMPFGAAAWIRHSAYTYNILLQMMIQGQASLADAGRVTLQLALEVLRPQLDELVNEGLLSLIGQVVGEDELLVALKDDLVNLYGDEIQGLSQAIVDALDPVLDAVTPDIIESWNIHIPDFADFKGLSTDQEILQYVRDGSIPTLIGDTVVGMAAALVPFTGAAGPFIAAFGSVVNATAQVVAAGITWAESQVDQTTLDTYGWTNLNWVARHSMALLTILQYGLDQKSQPGGGDGYIEPLVAEHFMWALFDSNLGRLAGADNAPRAAGADQDHEAYATLLQKAIAYSALDTGYKPFGDAGIRMLFNDLNDIGAIYRNPVHDPFLDAAEFQFEVKFGTDPVQFTVPMAGVLARIVTQYAGALALHAVERNGGHDVFIEEGLIGVALDQRTFAVDFSDIFLRDVLRTGVGYGNERLYLPDQAVLATNYLGQSTELDEDFESLLGGLLNVGTEVNDELLNELVGWGWQATDWRVALNRYHIRSMLGINELNLAERAYTVPAGTGDDANVDVYVGTGDAETVTGTKGNDFLVMADGNDIVHTGAGRDFVMAGFGDDHLFDDLGATDRDGAPRNDPDIYIGDKTEGNLLENYFDFLFHLPGAWADEDVLEYSVADPEVPGSLAAKGVTVEKIEPGMLGEHEAVLLTIKDENTGLSGTDTLVEIERVILSERADVIGVTPEMLAAPVWIDMGIGPKGGTVGKADFDSVSYAAAGKPIVTVNGATQTGDGNNGSLSNVSYLSLLVDLVGAAVGVPTAASPIFSAFDANDALRVTGAEKVELTSNDDVLWYGDINALVGLVTGWPAGDEFTHFGEIKGGAGNDLLVVRDARYVFAGEKLDADDPDSPTAATDLRLEVDGGEGEDRVMIVNGTGALAIGGPGRDFVFNWGYKGQLWGDTVDGAGGGDDVFWWSPGSFIMDAEQHDRLQMFGIPLTGGWGTQDGETNFVVDWLMPFVRYGYSDAGQLIVSWGDPEGLAGDDLLATAMVVNNFTFGSSDNQYLVSDLGDLGMTFRIYGQGDEVSNWNSIWGFLMAQLQALQIFAKSLHWDASDDPLVLDLDGDGAETTQMDFGPRFDLDGDYFAQRTGWVGADDGFLARDLNGNGAIDDVTELFGAPGISGFDMLATLDGNIDGFVDAADAGYASLLVWRDLDQDGVTDAGELATLAQTGIARIATGGDALGITVANGNQLQSRGDFIWSDGRTGSAYEVIFDTNPVDTQYLGDGGSADWSQAIDSKGYGKLTQLEVAAANDFALHDALALAAASMTVGDIAALRAQAQPVFEAWANALPQSRELAPVLIGADSTLLDRGEYVEDVGGGYWRLASGQPVHAVDGSVIARPTLDDVVAMGAAIGPGAGWRFEQIWSPAGRGAMPAARVESPYLVALETGRAQVLDHGILVTDAQGSYWRLASGHPVTDAQGAPIVRPQLADVVAAAAASGSEWRSESFGVSAAPFPFDKFAVYYKGGILTDYAVQVTDAQGSFFVWANNLRLALDYQARNGDAGSFGLRNYALDLDHLKDADNTVDSYVRAEIVSAGQVKFAAAAYGIVFEPDILLASIDAAGVLQYGAPIDETMDFFDRLMEHYSFFSRASAVHLASQGALAPLFRGVVYDADADAWLATSGRELAPMFEAIFEQAPAGRDPAAAYLEKWGEILDVIYPDLHRHGSGSKTQAFVFQMVVAAYENVPVDAELLKVAEVFGVDEEAVILHDAAATEVDGTGGADLFRLGTGDQTFRGGLGKDVYVVGKDFGHDVIEDIEPPFSARSVDTLRFAHVKSTDVYAYKDGIDLVMEVLGTNDVLTVRSQFEGVLPSLFGGDLSNDTEMVEITFADGVAWRELDIAWATSHPKDSDDLVQGTPAIDVLDGGRGDDILRGGRESDLYVFDLGYGNDRIEDDNDNILVDHYDVVQFGPTLRASDLQFQRIADSHDLVVTLVDDHGAATGDRLTVTNQFKSVNTWVFGVIWLDRIERFVFADGTYLAEGDVMRMTVEQARTDGEDAIFGFHFADRIDGGAANDYLSGSDVGDTYIFDRGYGHDVIEDNLVDFLTPSYDLLQLGGSITPAEIDLVRDGAQLSVTLALRGSDDRVTLTNEFKLTSTVLFGDYYYDNVDEVRFIDGTVWDMDALARMLLAQARTDGDDVIYGFDRADTLDGGAGNDRLEGGVYSDTYIFMRGYGHDTIFDTSTGPFLAPGHDALELQGIAFADIAISRFKEDLIFTVKDSGERITLEHQYNRFGNQHNAIEVLRFADQVVPYTDLNPEDVDLIGSAGDDTLWGTHFAETIDGLGGDDLLIGSSDGDRYRFDVGYGNDTVVDIQEARSWFNDDHVEFGGDITTLNARFSKDGNDLVVTIADRTDTLRISDQFGSPLAGVEWFHFSDGTTWTISDIEELLLIAGGGRGDDVITGLPDRENILDGRQGDDQLFGGRAADTYLFGLGYGLDTVTEVRNETALPGALDKVVFGSLVDPAALGVRRAGGDLLFTLVESGDELRVVNGLDQRLVEQYDFADGTVWTLADVRLAMLRGTDGDDVLAGFDDSADLLDGGFGSDELEGGAQDDIYRFGLGYGADGLTDSGGVADRIEFGELITAELLRLSADGDNLVIRLDGFDDSLVVRDTLGASDGARRIEALHFADGLEIGFDAVRQQLVDQLGTPGNDIVTGWTDRDDLIDGGAGDDELVGLGGNDLYRFASGHGLDLVDDRGGSADDRIVFGDQAASAAQVRRAHPLRQDVVISFGSTGDEVLIKGGLEATNLSAIETIEFADGTTWSIDDLRSRVLADAVTAGDDIVTGFASADRIEAGHGDDVLVGLAGADTYVFTRGDGRDLVRDEGPAADVDVLRIEGYVPDDVRVVHPQPDRNDLLLVFADTGDEILLRDQFNPAAGKGVEELHFGDGTVWSRASLVERISAGGTGADDVIDGSPGADTVIGRGGDDQLSGADGSDTYVFTRGDGRDRIEDNGAGDTDAVRLIGYAPADVQLAVALDAPDALVIRFTGSADELRIVDTLDSDSRDQIERFEFDDGTLWTIADVKAMLVAQPDPLQDDVITGFDGADTLAGGLGNDQLRGGGGGDTYVYRRNDGNDSITDNGLGGTDTVQLRGYLPAEVHAARAFDAADALELRFDGNADVLRIVDTLDSDPRDQIERVEFDDGTVWSIGDVKAMLVNAQSTPGDDAVTGFDTVDVLAGGLGDDTLSGANGGDIYRFARGDGHDRVQDGGLGGPDSVRLVGLLPAEVAAQRTIDAPDALLLRVAATGDELRIVDTLDSNPFDQIERFEFDDGTVWTIGDVKAMLVSAQSTAGDDRVTGFDTADVLGGGLGDDSLSGANGGDTYRFARGDGRDRIQDDGLGGSDTVRLVGLLPGEVAAQRALDAPDALLLRVAATGDELRIVNTLDGSPFDQVERFEFDDGTVWTIASVIAGLAPAVSPTVGSAGPDTMESTPAAEILRGGDGDDTYVWAPGDGIDVVEDSGNSDGAADRIVLSSVPVAAVSVRRDGNAAVLEIAESAPGAGDGGHLHVKEMLDRYLERSVESIVFDDGTVWTPATLRSMLVEAAQTPGDDTVAGFATAESFLSGLGDDIVAGGSGSDTYTYRRGDGTDVLDESGTFDGVLDRLVLQGIDPTSVSVRREGIDALLDIAESTPGAGDAGQVLVRATLEPYFERGFERIEFDDGTLWTPATLRELLVQGAQTPGNDVIAGFTTPDTFAPGAGNDIVTGGDGNDTYVYARGDGFDIVDDSGALSGNDDRIVLHGIAPAAVTVQRSGGDAVLQIAESAPGAGDSGRVVIRQTLDPYFDRGIERIDFDDGTSWSADDLRGQLLAAENTDTAATISGFSSDDIIDGGGGADHIAGGGGDDSYLWRHGDGDDVLDDSGALSGIDTLVLHGVDPADATLHQGEGLDLVLAIEASAPDAADGARITLKSSWTPYFERGIDTIAFDDGTLWSQAGFAAQAIAAAATAGDDVIGGSPLDDRMLGLAGNDTLRGGDGSDTYVFVRGDGRELIDDNGDGDSDALELRGYLVEEARFIRIESSSNDLLIRFAGSADTVTVVNGLAGTAADTVESFRFVDATAGDVTSTLALADIVARLVLDARTDGADLISGTGAADTLGGSAGPDVLDGGEGDDVYLFRRGDGDDRAEDNGASSADRLRLPDFNPADLVSVRRSPPAGLDLVLGFNSGDRIVLRDSLGDNAAGVEAVEFADGTTWGLPELRQRVLQAAATDGDEAVWGFDGDDGLTGGRGFDALHGGDGSDLYRYAAGDGADVIEDNGKAQNGGETDRIEIAGYTSAQTAVTRLYKGDDGVVLRFAGGDDTLTILNTLGGSAEDGIEQIAFADGMVWTMSDVLAALDNDAPVAQKDGFFSAVQGRELTLAQADLLVNDFDPNGDPLAVVAVGAAEHGSVRLDASGAIVYAAAADFIGVTSFEYTVSDGHNGLATQQVFLRVRPPASATDDSGLATAEDTLLPIRVERLLANDFDGDLMVISQVRDGVNGSVSLANSGDITFVPAPDFTGQASFRYVANTPDGGRAEASVTIEVTPANDAPVARDDAGFTTPEGVPTTIAASALLRNDTDIDGDRLTVTAVAGDGRIDASLTALGQIAIVPLLDFFGTAHFTYTIADGQGGSAFAQATLVVTPVNDAPTLAGDALVTDEDSPIFLPVTDLLANDSDAEGDSLAVTRVFGFAGGRAELFDNGTILFRPADDYYGVAGFHYEVDDGQGGLASARVDVQVNPQNDAPSARDEAYNGPGIDWLSGFEDQALTIPTLSLLGNDRDRDSATIFVASVSFATHGSVLLAGQQVVFTPDTGYWGEASFSYVASDGDGGVDDALVTMYFEPVSDAPPVAGDDEVTIYEDVTTVISIASLLANDSDIDADPLSVLWIEPFSVADKAAVALSRDANGDLVIAPALNLHGRVSLQYEVSDGSDGSDIGTIIVTIAAVNDDPVAADDSAATSLDAPLVVRLSDLPLNDTDIDIDDPDELLTALRVTSVQDPSLGTLSIYDGEFAVLEAPPGTSGDISFSYTLGDEAGGSDTGLVRATIALERAAVIAGGARRDLLIGTPGNERLEGRESRDDLFGRGGDDVLLGGDAADRLDGGDGIDTAAYDGSNIGVRADLEARIGQGGHAQGDLYVAIENLAGTLFADQLYGDGGANRLDGSAGHDLLDGRAGDDALAGGDGNDALVGGAGADRLSGDAGDDTADYGESASAVSVSLRSGVGGGGDAEGDRLDGIENLAGSVHADLLEGDDAANRLAGGRGADHLIGGAGDDVLDGGRDGDSIEGGAGSDTADYSGSLAGVTVDLTGQTAGGGDAAGDTFSGVENVRGSFHDDDIAGDSGDNRIEGGAGADALRGGGGFDSADYRASARGVTVDLAAGTGAGGDAQGDTLEGISGLIGSAHDDELHGDAQGNTFDGGFGTDLLAGAGGSDDYRFGFGARDDIVTDIGEAADTDRIVFDGAVRVADVGLVRRGDDLMVELEKGAGFLIDTITVAAHFAGPASGIERIVFGDGTEWSRDDIEARTRDNRFNAVNDLIRWADEDLPYAIAPDRLTANDSETPDPSLVIISVGNALHGSATLQADGSVGFLGAPDFNGDAFFDYTVADGTGRQSTATARVIVRPVNDAPTAGPDGVFDGAEDTLLVIPIATLLANDGDIDGDALRIVAFGPLLDANGDPLGEEASTGLGAAGTNGVAVFDLFAPNILFVGFHDYYGAAGFSYTVSDGAGGTAVANVELQLAAVNDGPRPRDDEFTTRLDTPIVIAALDLTRNDVEVEGDPITLLRVRDAEHGTVEIDAAGRVVFTPAAGFLGAASFHYEVGDGRGGEGSGVVTIAVIPPNDPPHAGDDRFELVEDEPLVITPSQLLANDSDPNGDLLSVVRLDLYPEKGAVAFAPDGTIVFTPKANYNGDASFYYWIGDGRGGEDQGNVVLQVRADNDAPFVNDDGVFRTVEDVPLDIPAAELLANDGDPDGDVLDFGAVDADEGRVVRTPDGLRYTPKADFVGSVLVRYRAIDDKGGISPTWATFTVEIVSAADLPTARADRFTLREGTPLILHSDLLLVNDFDGDGDPIRFVGVGAAGHGTVEQLPDGSIRFTPETGYFGDARYSYTITDDNDGESTGEVTIAITADNSLPVAGVDHFGGVEDEPVTVTIAELLANDIDPDGDAIAFVSFDETGDRGRATRLPGDRIVFTPDADVTGSVHFSYRISDGIGAEVQGSIEIDVAPVNDAPHGVDDFGFTVLEGQTLRIAAAGLLANDRDVEGDAFSLVGVDDAINGVVVIDGDALEFTPAAGFFGNAAFTYFVRDVHGAQSGAQVSIAVEPDNHPPTAVADSGIGFDEDGSVEIEIATLLANDRDSDGDPFELSWVGNAFGGTALLIDGGRIRFTGAADFFGEASLRYRITDPGGREGEATVAIDVRAINDAPIANDDRAATDEDRAVLIPILTLIGNDRDPDRGSFQLTSVEAAVNGAVVLDGIGNVIFTPAADFHGAAGFEYLITDLSGETARAAVSVEVASVNDAPDAQDDRGIGVTRDDRIIIDPAALLANDIDIDGDALLMIAAEGASHGRLETRADGRIAYIPDDGFVGSDQFRYTVSDGQASDEALAEVVVADPYIGWRQGTSGSDVLTSNLLADNFVYADSGDDQVSGGLRNDLLEGGRGNDWLNGMSGDDVLGGGDGFDELSGGAGNDRLSGGRDDDTLTGGWGADTFVFRRGDGHDTITDFAAVHPTGGDHIELSIPGVAGFNDLLQYARQTDDGVEFDFGDGDSLLIRGAELPSVQNDWFTFP